VHEANFKKSRTKKKKQNDKNRKKIPSFEIHHLKERKQRKNREKSLAFFHVTPYIQSFPQFRKFFAVESCLDQAKLFLHTAVEKLPTKRLKDYI
jgi:hypothetical protein